MLANRQWLGSKMASSIITEADKGALLVDRALATTSNLPEDWVCRPPVVRCLRHCLQHCHAVCLLVGQARLPLQGLDAAAPPGGGKLHQAGALGVLMCCLRKHAHQELSS